MLFLGPVLSIAAIVTTALLLLLTDASPALKVVATVACAATFFLPRAVPSLGALAGPAKALLSIVVIAYLKHQRPTR